MDDKIEIVGDPIYDNDEVEDQPTRPIEYSDAYANDKSSYKEEVDSGNWQAFQNLLLNDREKSRRADEDMFAGEKDLPLKKKQCKREGDPMVPLEPDYGEFDSHKMVGKDSINEKASGMRQIASDDQLLVLSYGRDAIVTSLRRISWNSLTNDISKTIKKHSKFINF